MKKIPESFIKNISEFLNDLNQIKSPSVLLVKILMQNPEKTNLVFNLMESQGVEKIFQSEIITKLSILDKKFNKNVEELDVKEFEFV